MTSASVTTKLRSRILATLDRHPRVRHAVIDVGAHVARRRGADAELVESAADSGDELHRVLQRMQWATALGGRTRFPRHFEPGEHITGAATRRRAADTLLADGEPAPGTSRSRQRIGVDDSLPLMNLSGMIRDDLEMHLRRRATAGRGGRSYDPDEQRALATTLTRTLEAVGVQPFLMSGSLLGVVRDGSFMPHDYDIDLGTLPGTDTEQVEIRLRQLESLRVERFDGRLVVTTGSGHRVDIFEHVERDGLFWHRTRIHEWWNTPFTVVTRSVGSDYLWIPSEPERYLDENYGRWDHPVAFYDISFDTPNRVYRQNRDALRHLYMHCLAGLESGDRWAVEAACRELRASFGVDVTDHLAPSELLNRPDHSVSGHHADR